MMSNPAELLFAAVRTGDVDAVRELIASGANPRRSNGTEMPLHVAARGGSLALVEALIEGGAFAWQRDAAGRSALDVARSTSGPDRDAIVTLLDRPNIFDPAFRAAVDAIHAGDIVALEGLLDAQPRLLRDRIRESEVYRRVPRPSYFLDPKLFWFVANNPTLVPRVAPNIVAIARTMIARGVERADLDYALELTMSSASARACGVQSALVAALIDAGATANARTIAMAAAHGELDSLRALLAAGVAPTPATYASFGESEALRSALASADRDRIQEAFGLAVINRELEAARVALEAGADVDAVLPVHAHSTALHQAAANDDVPMIELLLARGARTDTLDTLWEGTPLGWATHAGNDRAREALLGTGAG